MKYLYNQIKKYFTKTVYVYPKEYGQPLYPGCWIQSSKVTILNNGSTTLYIGTTSGNKIVIDGMGELK